MPPLFKVTCFSAPVEQQLHGSLLALHVWLIGAWLFSAHFLYCPTAELECNTDDESGSDDDGLRRPAVSSSEAGRPGQQQGSRPGRGFLGQPLQRSSWSTAQQQLGSNTHDGDDEEEEDGEDHDYSYEDEEESEGSWETGVAGCMCCRQPVCCLEAYRRK